MPRQPAGDSGPGSTEPDEEDVDIDEDRNESMPADINEGRRATDRSGGTQQESVQDASKPPARDSEPQPQPEGAINDSRRRDTAQGPDQPSATDAPTENTENQQGPDQPSATDAPTENTENQQGIEQMSGDQEANFDSRQDGLQAADETAAARELEQRVIDNNSRIDEESDVAVQRDGDTLNASLTPSGQSDILALRRQRAERSRDPQTGRTAAAIESFETGVRRQFAAENPGVEASDVTVTGTEQGQPGLALNQDAQAAIQGLTPSNPQGGRRNIQETSIENRTASGQTEVDTSEVNATVTDEGVSVTTTEVAPVVADRQGGRRQLQAGSLRRRTAQNASGVSPSEINTNLTDEGADPELTLSAREDRIEDDIVESRDEFREGDVRADVSESGDVDVMVTEQKKRRALREKAESEYPNAQSISITEQGGELVAKVERENDVERVQRLGENFVDDPVGSVKEGSVDIAVDLSTDAAETYSDIEEGVQNPGQTADWAISGVQENTIDPVAAGVSSFTADPVGATESATKDVAGGVVSLAEGGAEFSGGLARGLVNAGGQAYSDIRTSAGTGVGAAAVPFAAAEPTPFGEAALGTAAVSGGTALTAFYAGQEAGSVYDEGFETTVAGGEQEVGVSNQDVEEIGVPNPSQNSTERSEIPVTEDAGVVQQEIEVDEGVNLNDAEIRVPDSVDESEVSVQDGAIRAPVELTPSVQIGRETEREKDEEEDSGEEDGSDVADDEIVIELPEDSEYSPGEILEPGERPTPEDQPGRTPERAPEQSPPVNPTAPEQNRVNERERSSVVDAGVIGSEFLQAEETTANTQRRQQDAQTRETQRVQDTTVERPNPVTAVPVTDTETESVSGGDILNGPRANTSTRIGTRAIQDQTPATTQLEQPALSIASSTQTTNQTEQRTPTLEQTLESQIQRTATGTSSPSRGDFRLPALSIGGVPESGDASNLEGETSQYEYDLGDPFDVDAGRDSSRDINIPGMGEE